MKKVFSLAVLLLSPLASLTAAERPNVVYLLADDLGWGDLGTNGGSIPTPHLDRLFKEGVESRLFSQNLAVFPTFHGTLPGALVSALVLSCFPLFAVVCINLHQNDTFCIVAYFRLPEVDYLAAVEDFEDPNRRRNKAKQTLRETRSCS